MLYRYIYIYIYIYINIYCVNVCYNPKSSDVSTDFNMVEITFTNDKQASHIPPFNIYFVSRTDQIKLDN